MGNKLEGLRWQAFGAYHSSNSEEHKTKISDLVKKRTSLLFSKLKNYNVKFCNIGLRKKYIAILVFLVKIQINYVLMLG